MSASLRAAAREAIEHWRDLATLTAPSTWGWTAIPFLFAGFDAERAITPGLVVGVLALTAPLGRLRRGLDEAAAGRSGLSPLATGVAITAVGVPLLVLLAVLGGVVSAALIGLAAIVAALWAGTRVVPHLQALDQPWSEPLLIGAQGMLILGAGLTLGDRPFGEVPWLAAVAFGAWSVATAALRAPGDVRIRGWIALAGYAVAAALSIAIDGIGLAGGVALALYLLLPAMLLLAGDPATSDDPADRTAAERPGLDALVGGWLVVLLAVHWGVVAVDAWTMAIVATTGLTGVALANTVATRLATRRHRVRAGGWGDASPAVTIVVSGRPDDPWLATTVEALGGQTYADATVLVVDGGLSADMREEILHQVGPEGLVRAPAAPADGNDDAWAREAGARAASGELVLFVGSGTILAPVALRIMVEQLGARRLALLSAIPRLAMPSAGERAAGPSFAMLPFGFIPMWWSALTGGRPAATAVADAGLSLIDRVAYLEAADSTPRGGSAIAHAIAARGHRIGMIHGAALAVRHLDRTTVGAIDRWRRMVASEGTSIAATVSIIALELAAFVAPLLVLPAAILDQAETPIFAASTVPLVLLLTFRFALAVTQRQPLESIAWHPVSVAVAVVGQVASIGDRVRGRRDREEVVRSVN